jgi:uncharacterized protein (TIGR02147 family)
MDRPQLVEYLDFRRYLADWFAWKKATNPRFSHRMFARMSRQSNPSLLLQIIQGKRNLTASTMDAYIEALKLEEPEVELFHLLVRFDQSVTPDERNECFERISAIRRFQGARKLDGEAFRYLSRWHYVAVRELSLCAGFVADPAWIARTVRPPITEEEAAEAITLLTDLGMIEVHDDGSVTAHESTVATPHEVRGLAVYNFHRAMLGLASTCLDRVEPADRHVGAVTIAVPGSLVPQLKQELAAMQERLLDLADAAADPDRIYQVTLQLFPLSLPMGDPAQPAVEAK